MVCAPGLYYSPGPPPCHSDWSSPTLFFAPPYGASGCAVEESLYSFRFQDESLFHFGSQVECGKCKSGGEPPFVAQGKSHSKALRRGAGGDLADFAVFDDALAEVFARGLQHGAAQVRAGNVEAREGLEDAQEREESLVDFRQAS